MPSKSVKRLSRADLSDATVAALRNRVRRMYELGHSDVMIARCCGFSVDAVAAFRKRRGFTRAMDDLPGSDWQVAKGKIEDMIAAGATDEEISDAVGVVEFAVASVRAQLEKLA